ncbi:MAG: hypothetical protein RMJ43_14970 [Chloroherpetonaceae bacterium]|nr:hypothetical protein [Chthonomonadaceae bacterium]MDW8209134.1 hypothetical protein [Chloroherpetonaceae bacterium]
MCSSRKSLLCPCPPSRPAHPLWLVLPAPVALLAVLFHVSCTSAQTVRSSLLSDDQRTLLQKQFLSRRQLKALYYAVVQYAADNQGKLPSLNAPAQLKQQLKPYRLHAAALSCPFTQEAYRANARLAGKPLDKVKNPADTLLFWSPRSMPDGNYLVLDAAGRDRRVGPEEFARLKRTSGIP